MSASASDRPMMQMTVPVTSGGKNRSTIENGLGDDQAEDAGDEDRTVDVGQTAYAAVLVRDDDHRVQHREGRAGDDRQPHAE